MQLENVEMQLIDLQNENKFVNIRKRIKHHRIRNGGTECVIDKTVLETWNNLSDTFFFFKWAISLLTNASSTCGRRIFFCINSCTFEDEEPRKVQQHVWSRHQHYISQTLGIVQVIRSKRFPRNVKLIFFSLLLSSIIHINILWKLLVLHKITNRTLRNWTWYIIIWILS